MFAKLTALVGGGPALNYNIGDSYQQAWGPWSHFAGTHRDDNSRVSVFKAFAIDSNDRVLVAARNGVKRLKMLRHPNVLAYKDSLEIQEKGGTAIYLVTEPVKPLATVLQELDLEGQHRDEYLAMGMLHMASAVSFINNDCKLIHGYLCMAAVVVTESLDWKLHGFDLLSEHSLPGDFALRHASWLAPSQYLPGELAKADWEGIRAGPPFAVDAWGLGCMLQEVFSQQPLTVVENLRRTDCFPPALLQDYQRLLSSTPARRQNPSQVAASKFLNNKLVDVVNFMENISVKDSAEKDSFFKKLPTMVPSIPIPVACRKILPLLCKALEYGGAPPSALSSVLLIGKPLSQEDFLVRVVPCLSKLFASPDRNLRRNLLETMDQYGPHLTQSVVEDQIFPHLASGFTDENAYIRELTLKSMLVLAPKMKQATLTGNVLKHLSRLQVDQEAAIRANTTVLLGNLAQYLGDTYCKKVLLNAFGRALKDSFPPARAAALRALAATQIYYSPEEVACRALPAVAPLGIDPTPEVRSAALMCIEAFSNVLLQHDAHLSKQAEAAGAAPAAAPATSTSGVMGWAFSGLSASAGLLVGGATAAPAAAAAAAAPAAVSSAAPTSAAASRGIMSGGASGSANGNAALSVGRGAHATVAAAVATAGARRTGSGGGGSGGGMGLGSSGLGAAAAADGWDDDEDEFLDIGDEAEKQARVRLAKLSARPTPTSSSHNPPSTSTAQRSTLGPAKLASPKPIGTATAGAAAATNGWGDGEDEPWESMATNSSSSNSMAPPAGVGKAGVTATVGRRSSSGTGQMRPTGTRAAGGKSGAMKLGATKLGATKLESSML